MSGLGPEWCTERHAGDAGSLHELPEPDFPRRTARVMEVERPALVLGSSQRDGLVDLTEARARGIDVVRRRSGGGAVLVGPGAQTWIDLLIPAGDPLWRDDVAAAAWWVGETWQRALDLLGAGPAEVHRGRMVKTRWSALVCFAGLGPGELTVAARKVVGLSQRRNRGWIRVQTAAPATWDPRGLLGLLVLSDAERDLARSALRDVVAPLTAPPDDVVAAVLGSLPR